MEVSIAVRVGGPNSGHTVIDSSKTPIIFQHLPTAALLPNVVCVLPAGSYISPVILLREIEHLGLTRGRVIVDQNAVVIEEIDATTERDDLLRKHIGSTETGVGAALIRRIQRRETKILARDEPRLAPYIADTLPLLRGSLKRNERILIEGTQGYGLSLLHGRDYPYATSRDTTAAGFLSEVGLSPFDVEHVVLVLRSFPIRVAGNSGPLPNEISWASITKESGCRSEIIEHTSVTKSIRRVARFSPDIVRRAIAANHPSLVVLNHIDYVDSGCGAGLQLSERALQFVGRVEAEIGRTIDYFGLSRESILHRNEVIEEKASA
jgi:adenylosuccinate synthase